jgi:hypothetical protein
MHGLTGGRWRSGSARERYSADQPAAHPTDSAEPLFRWAVDSA